MRINIENALLRIPGFNGSQFIIKELIRNLKAVRDRTSAGDMGVLDEFFELYQVLSPNVRDDLSRNAGGRGATTEDVE